MNTLLIDVDWRPPFKEWIDKWVELRKEMLRRLGVEFEDIVVSYTDRGFHVWVWLKKDLPPEKVLELQFLLGDDPVRCKINYFRLKRGVFERYNLLFSKVIYRRPPDEKCMQCKLWRIYVEEVSGVKPPSYAVEFDIKPEEEEKVVKACIDISARDPTFEYRYQRGKLIIYSKDRDQAYKRGIWFKANVLGDMKRYFRVREIGSNYEV